MFKKKASDTSQLGKLEKPCNTQPEVTHGMAVIAWKICFDTDTTTHTVQQERKDKMRPVYFINKFWWRAITTGDMHACLLL